MRVRIIQSLLTITTLTLASSASAHFQLKAPLPSTAGDMDGKGAAPCGPDASSAVITPVMGGSQIAITVNETVFHPGHYRVALSIDSRDEIDPSKPGGLKEPVVKNAQGMPITSGNSVSADIQNPPVFPVLADGVFTHTTDSPTDFTQMITLPNVTCDKCTLQVIEFMAEHSPPYFYRHCADLKITADPAKPLFDPNGNAGGTGGTGGTGGAGGGGGAGGIGGSAAGAGGAATGGVGGAGGAGPAGGVPGAGGVVGTGGVSSTGGTGVGGTGVSAGGTGGTGAVPPSTPAEDEGGCSLGAAGKPRTGLLGSGAALLLGLGLLGRRRNRAR